MIVHNWNVQPLVMFSMDVMMLRSLAVHRPWPYCVSTSYIGCVTPTVTVYPFLNNSLRNPIGITK